MRSTLISLVLILLLGCAGGTPAPKIGEKVPAPTTRPSDLGEKCLIASDCVDGLRCVLGSCAPQAGAVFKDNILVSDKGSKRAKGGKISGCHDTTACPLGMFCNAGYCSRVQGSK